MTDFLAADPFDVTRRPQVNPEGPLSADRRWQNEAACIDSDVEFFSEGRGIHTVVAHAQAREVCAGCPVRRECLEYAFEQPSSIAYGTYAGTTGRQRKRLQDHPDRIELLLADELEEGAA